MSLLYALFMLSMPFLSAYVAWTKDASIFYRWSWFAVCYMLLHLDLHHSDYNIIPHAFAPGWTSTESVGGHQQWRVIG